MAEWTREEANRTINDVAKRATKDAAFRGLALKDPVAAIAKVNPTPIPTGFKIRFVDNAGANLTIVLPDAAPAEGELSDSQLEEVAGGGTASRCGGSCVVSCGISSVV
jgi:hypothetical protein